MRGLIVSLLLVASAAPVLSCTCEFVDLKRARKQSVAIFRGTIVSLDEGRARFRVETVWKGTVGLDFEMVGVPGDTCYSFRPQLLKVGSDLLVFAIREDPDQSGLLINMPCGLTDFAAKRAAEIAKLGRGRRPLKQ